MGKEKCVYVDAKKGWWTAEIVGENELRLIREETETLLKMFSDDFVELISAIVPVVLFVDNGDVWKMADPKNMSVVYPDN